MKTILAIILCTIGICFSYVAMFFSLVAYGFSYLAIELGDD